MATDRVKRVTQVEVLKSFTHPLRLRLFYALAARGSASATVLAKDVGTTAQLAHYHLTRLASLGVVEEDHQHPGQGRERNWKQASAALGFDPGDFPADPEVAGDVELLIRTQATLHFQRLQEFLAGHGDGPLRPEAFNSDALLHLTPAEMRQVRDELVGVLARWSERTSPLRPPGNPGTAQAADPPGGPEPAERGLVMVFLHGFPAMP